MKKLVSARFSNGAVNFALLLLRVIFGGLLFLNHGLGKLKSIADHHKDFPDPFHIGTMASFGLVAFAEGICTLLIVIGLLTRFATIPVIITMGVVVFLVKAHAGIIENQEAIMFLTVSLALLFTGPGRYSFDAAIGGK
jgi:putative oxidoreductase